MRVESGNKQLEKAARHKVREGSMEWREREREGGRGEGGRGRGGDVSKMYMYT